MSEGRVRASWAALPASTALAVFALAAFAGLTRRVQLLQGSNIRLYLLLFRNSLVALPVFLLWLRLSRRQGVVRRIEAAGEWWLGGRFTVPVALAFFLALTLLVAVFLYRGIPLSDAIWVMFQTKIFALGRLFAPAPKYPDFFLARSVFQSGKWFSYTSPGHSLTLLPGYLLGGAWLVGPLVGALGIWLLYRFGVRLAGSRTGRLMLLLAVTSPSMVFLFGGHDFHVSSLFFTILAVYLLARSGPGESESRAGGQRSLDAAQDERSPDSLPQDAPEKRRWVLFLAGLALGMVFLARPYTAVGLGLPLIVSVALKRRFGLIPFLLGGAIPVALHFVYNQVLSGSPFVFPYQDYGRDATAIGFSPDYGEPGFGGMHGHSVLRALINTAYQTGVTSMQSLGWLFLSFLFVIPAAHTTRFRRTAWLWFSALGLIVAYFFYWCHGITAWGAKYWSEALPALIAATAFGIRGSRARFGPGLGRDFALRAVPFLIAYSVVVSIPTTFLYLARNRPFESPKINEDVTARGVHHAVVFVHCDESSGSFDYTSAFIFNDPLLKGDIVYARDLGPDENQKLMREYPGRRFYLYSYAFSSLTPIQPVDSGP